MTEPLQAHIVFLCLFGLVCFSFGVRFQIDCARWKASQARKQLGRAILNTINL